MRLINVVGIVTAVMFAFIPSVGSGVDMSSLRKPAVYVDPAYRIQLLGVSRGDDWSLPASATPKPDTGFYDSPPELQNEDIKTLVLTWKELNPADGVYNWSRLDEALSKNFRIWLRVYGSDIIHVPDWVLQKYPAAPRMRHDTSEGPTYPDLIGNRSQGIFVAPWHEGVNAEFLKFLAAFGKRDVLAHHNLAFMYAPNAWRWNEWVTKFVPEMRQQGLTPDAYFAWFRQLIDAYALAGKGHRHKLVFTGYGTADRSEGDAEFVMKLNDMETGTNLMTDYAVRAGMSVRVGDLEYFNQFDAMPAWGAPFITENGLNYQVIEPTHPLRTDPRRIIASENEAFGDPGMLGATTDPYYVKMVTLKSLQLGMNWLNIQHYGYELNPSILQYARRVLGKTATESPDAWVALRSFRDMLYVPSGESVPGMPKVEAFIRRAKGEFRNWERYLIQREISPGGQTFPAAPNSRSAFTDKKNGPGFEAIRTDRASGNDSIFFKVDKLFADSTAGQPIQIKVTYLDNGAEWVIAYYPAGSANEIAGPKIANRNSGQWKTASFLFPRVPVSDRYPSQMDFRLQSTGGNDLTTSLVRMVKSR